MNGLFISQNELAQRWKISKTTLERWCAERIGPSFLKLGGQVGQYNLSILIFQPHEQQSSPKAALL